MESMYYETILLILVFALSIIIVIVGGIVNLYRWLKEKRSDRELRNKLSKSLEKTNPMDMNIQEGIQKSINWNDR
jgi:predicted PurR-regulated permease PerM